MIERTFVRLTPIPIYYLYIALLYVLSTIFQTGSYELLRMQ